MLKMAGVVAALLLLSGCVTAPRPAGLTATEQQEFDLLVQERQWEYFDIADRTRPVVEPIAVSANDRGRRVYECLVEAGLGDLYALGSDGQVGSVGLESADDQVAYYVCSMTFMPPARYWGYLSRDELNAAYDYFQDFLVPCLEAHDYQLPLAPPRGEVATKPGYLAWDPYSQLGTRITNEATEALQRECPTVPPWLYN